ncbi:hypothetical protein ScPMuIL_004904 [Solemya velum]
MASFRPTMSYGKRMLRESLMKSDNLHIVDNDDAPKGPWRKKMRKNLPATWIVIRLILILTTMIMGILALMRKD